MFLKMRRKGGDLLINVGQIVFITPTPDGGRSRLRLNSPNDEKGLLIEVDHSPDEIAAMLAEAGLLTASRATEPSPVNA